MDADRIRTYWRSYLDTLPADSPVRDEQYVAEGLGDSPEMADELGALIAAGTKTATCSAQAYAAASPEEREKLEH